MEYDCCWQLALIIIFHFCRVLPCVEDVRNLNLIFLVINPINDFVILEY